MKKILSRRDPGSVRIFLSESDDTHKTPSMASFDRNAASRAAGRSWRNNSMSHRMAGRRPSISQEYHSIKVGPTSVCTRQKRVVEPFLSQSSSMRLAIQDRHSLTSREVMPAHKARRPQSSPTTVWTD